MPEGRKVFLMHEVERPELKVAVTIFDDRQSRKDVEQSFWNAYLTWLAEDTNKNGGEPR